MRFVAIMGGGDWTDASVEHLAVPDGMKLEEMKALYDVWYRDEYHKAPQPPFMTFPEYLKQQGARSTTDEEVEEFWEGP